MSEGREGGFFPPMPSPPASTASHQTPVLPPARETPLKPGSRKESSVISYIDSQLLEVSRKFERRYEMQLEGEDKEERLRTAADSSSEAYRNFGQLAADVDRILDVVWVSSTRSLQIPYLLNIALNLIEYFQAFTFSPKALFPLLYKIDVAFASMMRGVDVESQLPLSGIGTRTMTTTEQVRLRTIVENTRIAVCNTSRKHGGADFGTSGPLIITDTEDDAFDTDAESKDAAFGVEGRNWTDVEMESARIYELSLGELGLSVDLGPLSPEAVRSE